MKTLTAIVIAMLLAAFAATAAQQESSKNWTQPRTPDGQPDLQGTWTNYTSTPFEVPDKSDTPDVYAGDLDGSGRGTGPSSFLTLMSMVSLQLAIFNLLPIPILDGGVILMLLVEMMMQRDLSLKVKEKVFQVGFVCIMVIVAFVIYNDISKILPAG